MVKTVDVKAKTSDAEFAKHEGEWFTAAGLQIFDEDVDVYGISHPDDVAAGKPERKLLAKLRKKAIPKETVQIGWDAFRLLAIPSRNRGAAAGPIDTKGVYWSRRDPAKIDKWSAQYYQVKDGKKVLSKMRVNNVVASGVIGYYEKTPFLGQPCRMTGYTRSGLKQFIHGLPFLEAIDRQFKALVPAAHKKQLAEVSKKPMYQIGDTAFSTLTVNSNFRTALHKDAGDYRDGFGNLSVIEWGKYHGGETLFPRFGVGFNIRTGDFVAMDVHEWHTNAPVTSQELYQRLSFVCYFREKIADCIEKETREYYKSIDFDLKQQETKARRASVPTLVLPGLTGTVEEARGQVKVGPRHTVRKRAQTEKHRRRKHFI
jgi:hypothetical protein